MIQRPTEADIATLADGLGMTLPQASGAEILAIIDAHLSGFDTVMAQPDPDWPVAAYDRSAPMRPEPADNPHNAWAWRMVVQGAATGPLQGCTVALKDTILLAGAPMSNGSKLFDGHVADMDATVVTRMLDAGATILGKAQCEDFCVSGGSHTSAFGPVHNPRRLGYSAGGSSSGSGALVASGAVDMAIGGDQGGSIRIPAAYCGINGMKPSWGLVPYTGAASIETSLDHLGPMTRTVAENARLLTVIAGDDGADPRQCNFGGGDYTALLEAGVQGLRIGVLTEGFDWPEMDERVRNSVLAGIGRLQAFGAIVEPVSVPLHKDGRAFTAPVEIEGLFGQIFQANGVGAQGRGPYSPAFMAAQAGWRQNADALHDLVKIAVLAGAYMTRLDQGRSYARAHALRARLAAAYNAALAQHDVLVMPTLPMIAQPLPPPDASLALSFQRSSEMVCNTAQFDLTGHPALSTPCGLVDGLPVGLMIVGRMFDEANIYRAAAALERSAHWTDC
ncbi:amidase [Acidisoma silvae]|uniref:Amidase n=1 Tax=Acidisoma silvae TaxID=2802396 RepID=A0A963YVF0_9PROT|nr:amidase [Acidisoma silvae]MCB8877571.1 amidase [Acidisoma silvae]